MVQIPYGFSFLKGVFISIFGFLIWLFATTTQNIISNFRENSILFLTIFIYIGILIIIIGPLWYWILRPLYYYIK